MQINDLVQEVYGTACAKGWWDEERSFPELIALCHSELSEALEDYRNGFAPAKMYYEEDPKSEKGKPCGIPSELADVVIRIMDMCGHYNIDLEKAILEKMEYNQHRPRRHGGKKL